MKHHIIYLPGLSDHKPGQAWLLQAWRLQGITPHFHYLGWHDQDETFESKLMKVVERIDQIAANNVKVSLVGTSAGASMALHAYLARREKIHRLIFLCGKLQHIETVSEDYYQKNPSFRAALGKLPGAIAQLKAVDKAMMLTVRPRRDPVVSVKDMLLPGVKSITLPTSGHGLSIVAAVTIYSPRLIQFLKT
jgi:pimeloyl-ACP methyl ester carboxylesterase